MGVSSSEHYIPYQATAEAMVEDDGSPRLFLLSLMPDATEEQLAMFVDYTTGKLLDGIHLGRQLSAKEPISAIDAYKLGVQEGQQGS